MFKTLQRKFVMINMSLLTFVFVAIFAAIYILTAFNSQRQLTFTLNQVMNMPPKLSPIESRMATSLLVELNNNNELIVFSSFITMEEEVIKEAVAKAIEVNKSSGKIKVGNYKYSFLKEEVPFGIKIAFVDRKPMEENLKNMLRIFIVSGMGSLILLFLISLYLAKRTIQPIKETFEKQEQFIADASHELKTPLAIINTNLSVIASNPEEKINSQAKWLGFIQSQTERMSELINDLLSLAKMDGLKQPLLMQSFNLSNILEGVLLYFEASIFENNIIFKSHIEKNISLYGDKDSLERVINILIDNAIKNTPSQGSIFVNLLSKKNMIEMEIKNTGKGISPENIDKVFERFFREDSSRARESGGYGLGLAIAKSIIQKHDGKIYVESNVGVDTTFVVKLPKEKNKGSLH